MAEFCTHPVVVPGCGSCIGRWAAEQVAAQERLRCDWLTPAQRQAATWMAPPDDGRARWGEDGDRAFSDGTPLPQPPTWAEQEWCDGGGTCEHYFCQADRYDRQADMLRDACEVDRG